MGQISQRIYEENDQLKVEKKRADVGKDKEPLTIAVGYDGVSLVRVDKEDSKPNGRKTVVFIQRVNGLPLLLTVPSEDDARELADYIGKRSSLERIADTWRVRKLFDCPPDSQPGCASFQELLKHDDPDIVNYFYDDSDYRHTYACFSTERSKFTILQFSHWISMKFGLFTSEEFVDGQSVGGETIEIDWPTEDYGQIKRTEGKTKKAVGSIDDASLSYQTVFTNRMNTKSTYTLQLRFSTGRFTDNVSGKDDKGVHFDYDSSGVCAKLH